MNDDALDKLRSLGVGREARPGLAQALGLERGQSLTMLALDKIAPNPKQPRQHFSEEKLQELVLSVRERGVLQPIRVRELKTNEAYEIIAGERRWRAAKEVGLTEIPAVIVRDQAPEQSFIDALLENVVREDLNPIDRAEALVQVRVNLGLRSWDEVGNMRAIGLSRQQIYNLLGLSSLPDPVKDDIRTGVLTEKHGRALRTLRNDPKLLDRAWHHMKAKTLSGDDALAYARSLKQNTTTTRTFKIAYRTDLELIQALEAKLRELRATPSD
jgi:ParB family chromosome partitioning protein